MVALTGNMSTNQRKNKMEFFHFYLDAWKFCKDNQIDLSKIKRNNWTTWVVEVNAAEEI